MKNFISVLKNGVPKASSRTQNKTGREMHQLLETNCTGAGKMGFLKGTCKQGDKAYAGSA
jgi:hypothetical protein